MLILYQFYINSVPKNLYKFATILLNMDLTSSPPPFITKMLEKLQYCRGMASLIVSSAPRMMAGLWSSLYFPDFDLWLLSVVMDGIDDSDEYAKQRPPVIEWHYAMRHLREKWDGSADWGMIHTP